MANPFDQFDTQETQQANPFDQFDAPEPQKPKSRPLSEQIRALNEDMGFRIPEDATEEEYREILQGLNKAYGLDAKVRERNQDVADRVTMGANAVQRFGNSATLGAPDFVLSKAQQATGLGENIRDVKADLKEQFPKSSAGADIGGAIYGLGKAYDAGKTFTRFIPKGLAGKKKVAATTAALAADGAVIGGATAGFNEQDIGEGAKAGAMGGAIGGALSPVVEKVAPKISAPLIAAFNKISGKGPKKLAKPEAKAVQILLGQAEKAGMSRQDVYNAIKNGDGELVFQRLGMVDDARGFAAVKTDAQRYASDQVWKAKDAQRPAMEAGMREALGDVDYSTRNAGITGRLKETSKQYEEVFSQPIQKTDKLKALESDPYYKAAAREAERMAAGELRRSGVVNEAKKLQMVKEALDDQIGKAIRAGESKKATAIKYTKNELLEELDGQLPGFAEVRKLWGGEAANRTALEDGRKILNQHPRDIAEAVGSMSESERRHYMTGMLDALGRKMDKRADGSDLTRIFTDDTRNQIRAVLPEDQAEIFIQRISNEGRKRRELNAVDPLSGSQTQPRQEAAAAAMDLTRNPVAVRLRNAGDKLASADMQSILSQPIRAPGKGLRYLARRASSEDEEVIATVTRMLFADADEVTALYSRLDDQQTARVNFYIRKMWGPSVLAIGANQGQ